MKKPLLILAILLANITVNASHMMGGQMTSRNIGGLTYEITLTAYRDMNGIQISLNDAFNYDEVGGPWTAIHNVPQTGMIPFGNNVEEYKYIDTITFPYPGNFTLWFEECCRNAAVLNYTNPGAATFHLYNNIFADPTNSSPVFLNPPIPVAQVGVIFNYNPLPFDADGDSIDWTLDIPRDYGGVAVTGYTLPPSDPSMPFTMNPSTGEISFLPNVIGHFEVSCLVNEYRNGVKIGEIRRDMQIIVEPGFNTPPIVTAGSNTYPYTGKNYDVLPGSNINLAVSAYDPDGQLINITAAGEPFLFANNAATFSVINNVGISTSSFIWSPVASQARTAPYIVALRVADHFGTNTFFNDITFSFRVGNFTGIDVLNNEVIRSIYPNPNDGNFTLELNVEKGGAGKIIINNMIGQQLRSIDQKLEPGTNLINIRNTDLPSGNYFISVIQGGNQSRPQNLHISK